MTRLGQPGYEEYLRFKSEAESKNDAMQRQLREPSTFGVAKPVIAFPDDTYAPQWRLFTRKMTTSDGAVKTTLTALDVPVAGAPPAPVPNNADDLESATRLTDNLQAETPASQPQDMQGRAATAPTLEDYVSRLAKAYRLRPSAAQQGAILHALHRLQIYAKLAADRFNDGPSRAASGEPAGYRAFFAELLKRVESGDPGLRRADIAKATLGSLKDATGYYRELSLSLLDVSYKLATKTGRDPRSENNRTRLVQLVTRGLETISSETRPADLQKFLSSFAYASRCFYGANVEAEEFSKLLDKVVENLRHQEVAGRSPLFDLFQHLTYRLLEQKDDSMIAPLESLLNNAKFNVYLENLTSHTEVDCIKNVLPQLVRDDRHAVWQAGARLLARRPSGEFFERVEGLVKTGGNGCVAKVKLNYVFDLLNTAFSTARACRNASRAVPESTMYREAQHRYRGFLTALVQVNRLHLVETAAATSDTQSATRQNLQCLYNVKLENSGQLQGFFSNAGFRVAQSFAHHSPVLLRDVEAILQLARSNPVHNVAKFEHNFKRIANDYNLGLPNLRGLLLRTLGASSAPAKVASRPRQKSQPVEDWLNDTMIPDYHRLMRVVLGCYPLSWWVEDIEAPDWYDGKLVMAQSGGLFVARCDNGKPKLVDIVDHEAEATDPDDGEKYYSADGGLNKLYQDDDSLSRNAQVKIEVEGLVHNSRVFSNLGLDQDNAERMDRFLDKLLVRLQLDSLGASPADGEAAGVDADAFATRISAVATFFSAVSELQRSKLEKEAGRRFFRGEILTEQGRKFLADHAKADTSDFATLRSAIADLLCGIGCSVIERFFNDSADAKALIKDVTEIASIFNREIDYQAYTTKLIVESFNKRHRGGSEDLASIEVDEQSAERLRQSLYDDSRTALRACNIDYILPNQALAAELCRREDMINENILLKMGTGQGKSIVIAMTALHEARRLAPEEGVYVFVLTSYDHLAVADHAKGQKFFQGIQSACLEKIEHVDGLCADTKIIYANVKTLQAIAQDALSNRIRSIANPNKYPPNVKQMEFLRKLYTNAHSFILDEYDLVLNDLDYSSGKTAFFTEDVISKVFVDANRAYAPVIASCATPVSEASIRGTGRDPNDGEGYGTITEPYVTSARGTGYYLRPGALRVSQLLKKARRIMGLSGSTEGDSLSQVVGLEQMRAKYFELPSSRDPDSFGTRCVDSKDLLNGVPGIWRTQEKQCHTEAEYITSIVNDVRAVRVPREVPGADGCQQVRPVMIFVDPEKKDLTGVLLQALKDAFGSVDVKLNAGDIEGSRLQEIGFPGRITLVSTLCGRGADIYVSPDVPDSMHVVIATSIPTERLKIQMIGRTGRMGRDGSYSVITMGNLIAPRSTQDNRIIENYLHDFSDDLVRRLMSPQGCDKAVVLKWLLLNSEIAWSTDKDSALLNALTLRL